MTCKEAFWSGIAGYLAERGVSPASIGLVVDGIEKQANPLLKLLGGTATAAVAGIKPAEIGKFLMSSGKTLLIGVPFGVGATLGGMLGARDAPEDDDLEAIRQKALLADYEAAINQLKSERDRKNAPSKGKITEILVEPSVKSAADTPPRAISTPLNAADEYDPEVITGNAQAEAVIRSLQNKRRNDYLRSRGTVTRDLYAPYADIARGKIRAALIKEIPAAAPETEFTAEVNRRGQRMMSELPFIPQLAYGNAADLADYRQQLAAVRDNYIKQYGKYGGEEIIKGLEKNIEEKQRSLRRDGAGGAGLSLNTNVWGVPVAATIGSPSQPTPGYWQTVFGNRIAGVNAQRPPAGVTSGGQNADVAAALEAYNPSTIQARVPGGYLNFYPGIGTNVQRTYLPGGAVQYGPRPVAPGTRREHVYSNMTPPDSTVYSDPAMQLRASTDRLRGAAARAYGLRNAPYNYTPGYVNPMTPEEREAIPGGAYPNYYTNPNLVPQQSPLRGLARGRRGIRRSVGNPLS